jgi:hypothetical protein
MINRNRKMSQYLSNKPLIFSQYFLFCRRIFRYKTELPMKTIFQIVFVFFTLQLFAQIPYSDEVHLKNGSILKCRIIEFKIESQIKLEIQGGSVLVYNSSEIAKINRGIGAERKDEISQGHFYTDELYFTAFFNFIGGYREAASWSGAQDIPTLGCGLKFSGGKAINRHLMIGAGVGWSYMHNYFMYSAHFPVFAEVRGDILKKTNSLYYSFGLGYNIAKQRNAMSWIGTTMIEARGGVYMNPALGLRFASKSKKHFCLELNYGIHTASYSYTGTNGEIIGPTNNVFIRPTLALGMLF